jgi:calcium permeable stress-gated cation channel
MPSQYYKLRGVDGISGGHFTDQNEPESSTRRRGPSLTESFNQRVVGSRFQEVSRDSVAYGRLPIGSQVTVAHDGQLGGGPLPYTESPVPDAAPYAPGAVHASWDTAAFNERLPPHQWWAHQPGEMIQEESDPLEDWVDILNEDPEAFQNAEEYNPRATPPRRRSRPPRPKVVQNTEDRRETFPRRARTKEESEEQPPPHLRIQPRQPFVRPLSGLDHDDLGRIYADINMWRAKLKGINNEIGEVQRECYNDIADGARIKGWLMVGRGLRFIPGIQLIEGRAKEDIRWDELQNEGGPMRTTAFWIITVTIGVLLGILRE